MDKQEFIDSEDYVLEMTCPICKRKYKSNTYFKEMCDSCASNYSEFLVVQNEHQNIVKSREGNLLCH